MLKTADNWRKSEMSEELKPGSQEESRARVHGPGPAPHCQPLTEVPAQQVWTCTSVVNLFLKHRS